MLHTQPGDSSTFSSFSRCRRRVRVVIVVYSSLGSVSQSSRREESSL